MKTELKRWDVCTAVQTANSGFYPRLGVVTAPTGAAVQDIRNISLRRNPYLQIILYPALVQGEGAADSIYVESICWISIVGRGGWIDRRPLGI